MFLCVLAFSILFAATGLRAQTTNGSIQGTVTDPSGAPIGGANVTGRNLDTALTLNTVTSDAGLYSLANVPPGRYSVTIDGAGMKKYTREGVTVQTGSTTSLDVSMQLGATTENVTVTADASQLETATSDIGATVENSLIQIYHWKYPGRCATPFSSSPWYSVRRERR